LGLYQACRDLVAFSEDRCTLSLAYEVRALLGFFFHVLSAQSSKKSYTTNLALQYQPTMTNQPLYIHIYRNWGVHWFNYGYWRCMFVDSLLESKWLFLFRCAHYWVWSSWQNLGIGAHISKLNNKGALPYILIILFYSQFAHRFV
jgi:hypothetical protein